mmetsp:Transcript_8654/g.14660  ORF Transcript_8654/g.14660 Transcript_8654/m.14660 type:complete len:345 (-) Transcript_8654:376-1410(-)
MLVGADGGVEVGGGLGLGGLEGVLGHHVLPEHLAPGLDGVIVLLLHLHLEAFLEELAVFVGAVEVDHELHYGLGQDLVEVELAQDVHEVGQIKDSDRFAPQTLDALELEGPLDEDDGDAAVPHLLEDLEEGVGVLALDQVLVLGEVGLVLAGEFAEPVLEEADLAGVVVYQEPDHRLLRYYPRQLRPLVRGDPDRIVVVLEHELDGLLDLLGDLQVDELGLGEVGAAGALDFDPVLQRDLVEDLVDQLEALVVPGPVLALVLGLLVAGSLHMAVLLVGLEGVVDVLVHELVPYFLPVLLYQLVELLGVHLDLSPSSQLLLYQVEHLLQLLPHIEHAFQEVSQGE